MVGVLHPGKLINLFMFRNYLLVAVRNLKRNKIFSFINITGLALGMACSLLIMLWVQSEYNVDAFNKNSPQLYSVFERQFYQDRIDAFHSTPGLMADEMKRAFPEVEYASGFGWINTNSFAVGDKIINENGGWAGQDFFKMFSYPLLEGDATTALNSPSCVAISREMAQSFFGSAHNAINKTIRFQNRRDFKITAVFDNTATRASQKFDYLINWYAYLDDNPWLKNWSININDGPHTYIMLRKGTDAAAFQSKIKNFLNNYFKDQSSGFHIQLGMQRFDEMYLYSHFTNGEIDGGRIEYVKLFSAIAIFILVIACVNFMNLTTARFMKRAKEIGIRKVAGAVRFSLVKQFIGEAILIAFVSSVIALGLVLLLLPLFNNITHKEITLPLSSWYFWPAILLLSFATGLIAGSYPAIFLSSFDPIKVLKGSIKAGPRAALIRKGLVVFQFVLSIILIIGMIVISQQLRYMQTKNLGYNKDNVVSVPLQGNLLGQYTIFKQEALNIPGVEAITRITQIPTEVTSGTSDVSWQNKDPGEKTLFTWASAGYDLIKTMGLEMVEGRDFSKAFPTDSSAYIINESALKVINYKDPIGKQFTFWGRPGTIIGIVKDFHFNSLHDPIRPLILRMGESESFGVALVSIDPAKTKQVLTHLGALSGQFNPQFPFTYQFLDEAYEQLYASEQMINQLATCFAILAVAICCLGLLGLIMFTAEQRRKEVGIRKVLGANTVSLFGLLSKEFLALVLVAYLIASPLAWWAAHNWLGSFAYRINITWWMFLLAGSLAMLIALATISVQAIKTAVANPVKSLRTE
jgi:ABC-type antimicrobial peptide transport system permease subunit